LNYYRYHNDVLFCSKECTGKWLSKQFTKVYRASPEKEIKVRV
jgi:hypothetical protein